MKDRMVQGKRLGVAILAVALAALLLVTACAPAPTAPAGEKTVEVAGIMPLTGAASGPIQMQLLGFQDYFRYFDEQEAIPGVSIKFLWGDTMMQYAVFASNYEKSVMRGIPLIFATESIPVEGLKGRFAKDEVVVMGSATGFQDMCYSPGWRYFISPTLAEQFAVVAEYFKGNWKEARPPRFAFVGMDFTWGYEPQAEGTKYAQSLGFEVLPPEIVPFIVLDATTQLLRLKEEGADLVYLQALPSAVGPVLRDAERLELLGQMHFAGNPIGMPESVIKMTGVASEGFLMPFTSPWFDETEVPGIKLMIDNRMKYHNEKVQRDASYRNGWIEAAIACEAIRRTIENVGYDNLDGAAIKEALDNMKDFDVYGLASITYKDRPLDHRGITTLAVYEVRDGKEVRLSDWRESPTLVPEGLIRE
ncbi:ABC transporter substrate-binding protein [Chloroflexota bacterium]